jgi:alpha-galactosidase
MHILKRWVLSSVLLVFSAVLAMGSSANGLMINIQREPDSVFLVSETGGTELEPAGNGLWTNESAEVTFSVRGKALAVELGSPRTAPKTLEFRWNVKMDAGWKYLGDAWERAYGDLAWLPLDVRRVMPWYFLASDGTATLGLGVKTGPGALCWWTVNADSISLHADVRCGGRGVQLGNRTLKVCTVIGRENRLGETSFATAQSFCRIMCAVPRLPKEPVYGFNDWYCSYGHDTADNFLANVTYLISIGPKNGTRPFAVVDDGWQWKGKDGQQPGLWNQTDPSFSGKYSMPEFAKKVSASGARPGLWYRPLIASVDQPKSWRLQRDADILDPTVPEVRSLIKEEVARFHGWGFELIKHDYTTYDLCGRWGKDMGAQITDDGWTFADRSKTTAEVIRDLYQDIRDAAGENTVIIGCNTMGHLAAGIFEMQRIGDDTSGREWNRTREMGVNCLAFRAPQNGTFFAIDADCAGQVSSNSVPWEKNSQWLHLLAHSGTPLFVSFPHETVSAVQEIALREALDAASRLQPLAEPVDWMSRRAPEQWLLGQTKADFSW